MPTYDYKCKNCGHEFEDFHSISDDTTQTCPKCGEESAERQISSGSGLIFKGSGFYITDYSDSGNNQQSSSTDSSSKESQSTQSSSETKSTKETNSSK